MATLHNNQIPPFFVKNFACSIRFYCILSAITVIYLMKYTNIETYFVLFNLDVHRGDSFLLLSIAIFRLLNHFYLVPVVVVSSYSLWLLLTILSKERFKYVISSVITTSVFYFIVSLCLQQLPSSYYLFFLITGLMITILANVLCKILTKHWHHFTQLAFNIYICIPFLAEVFTPYLLTRYFINHHSYLYSLNQKFMKTGLIYTLLVVNVLVFYILTIQSINKGYLPDLIKGRGERITTGDYYSLQIDKKRNYLLAAQHEKSKLVVFDIKKNPPLKVFEKKILTEELECFRINPERNEFYHFDRGENKLLVYDLQTFTLKRESSSNTAGKGNATLAYDNHSKTISVGREGKGNSIWLFDMDTAEPIHEIKKLGFRTESNRYSQILKKYVITHYFDSPNITVVNPNDYRSQVINAFFFQADLAESLQHEKLYVAFPIEGLIRVIDLKSFGRIKKHKPEIREYISTVHGVRKIAYDETNDLLLAASTNNGYVDIIKPATGKILKRMFVGYYLREIALYENRREAYIASQIGGIYKINY